MLKNILKLNGAQQLSKNEQKNIAGSARTLKPSKCFCTVWSGGRPADGGYFICITNINECP